MILSTYFKEEPYRAKLIVKVRQRTLLRDWLPPSFGIVGLVTWVRKVWRCWLKKDASTK